MHHENWDSYAAQTLCMTELELALAQEVQQVEQLACCLLLLVDVYFIEDLGMPAATSQEAKHIYGKSALSVCARNCATNQFKL